MDTQNNNQPRKAGRAGKPVRRTQEQRSQAAQMLLLNSAIELICLNGYIHTTTQQIANHAGLTRGAIQHHFNSRAELFASILKHVEKQWRQSFEKTTRIKHLSIEERIDVLIDELWKVIKSPAYRASLDIYMNSRLDAQLRPQVKKTFTKSTRQFHKLWDDTFSPEISKEKLVATRNLVISISQGTIMTNFFTESPERLSPSVKSTFFECKQLLRTIMLDQP